jgi:hypothetical protein
MTAVLEYRDHWSVLPGCREVMGEEDIVQNQDQEGYLSLWEMFLNPVRDTVRAQSLAKRVTPDGFLDLLRIG